MTTATPSTQPEQEVPVYAVTPSTEEPQPQRRRSRLRRGPAPVTPALMENELGSTERPWAIKPPPGMESDPFTWENLKRDLG